MATFPALSSLVSVPVRRAFRLGLLAGPAALAACVSADRGLAPAPTQRAELAGQWALTKVAGVTLPAIVDSVASPNDPSVTRIRLDSAQMALDANGSWSQVLYFSGWRSAGNGTLTPVFVSRQGDHGHWAVDAQGVRLTTAAGAASVNAGVSATTLRLPTLPTALDGVEAMEFARR
jgi:hypothetical protein